MTLRRITLLVTLFIAGCATLDARRGLAEIELSGITKLGVVSLLGTQFNSEYEGPLAFNNKTAAVQVPEWQIDRLATELVQGTVAKRPGLDVVALDTGTAAAKDLLGNARKLSWEKAEQQGLDHLLFLHPGSHPEVPFHSYIYGYRERYQFDKNLKCIYVAYVVSVYKVQTRKLVAWQPGGKELCVRFNGSVAFKENFSDYSSEEKEQLRSGVVAHLKTSVPYALNGLALAPKQEK